MLCSICFTVFEVATLWEDGNVYIIVIIHIIITTPQVQCFNVFSHTYLCIWLYAAFTKKVVFGTQVCLMEYLSQEHVSRSSGQGQGHRSKKRVCVFCLRVVCLQLNDLFMSVSIFQQQQKDYDAVMQIFITV